MTRERRLVLSLDEIAAVRWQCPQCAVALTYPITETIRLPERCPSCTVVFKDGDLVAAGATLQEFVRTLKAAIAVKRPGLVRLEFIDEEKP